MLNSALGVRVDIAWLFAVTKSDVMRPHNVEQRELASLDIAGSMLVQTLYDGGREAVFRYCLAVRV